MGDNSYYYSNSDFTVKPIVDFSVDYDSFKIFKYKHNLNCEEQLVANFMTSIGLFSPFIVDKKIRIEIPGYLFTADVDVKKCKLLNVKFVECQNRESPYFSYVGPFNYTYMDNPPCPGGNSATEWTDNNIKMIENIAIDEESLVFKKGSKDDEFDSATFNTSSGIITVECHKKTGEFTFDFPHYCLHGKIIKGKTFKDVEFFSVNNLSPALSFFYSTNSWEYNAGYSAYYSGYYSGGYYSGYSGNIPEPRTINDFSVDYDSLKVFRNFTTSLGEDPFEKIVINFRTSIGMISVYLEKDGSFDKALYGYRLKGKVDLKNDKFISCKLISDSSCLGGGYYQYGGADFFDYSYNEWFQSGGPSVKDMYDLIIEPDVLSMKDTEGEGNGVKLARIKTSEGEMDVKLNTLTGKFIKDVPYFLIRGTIKDNKVLNYEVIAYDNIYTGHSTYGYSTFDYSTFEYSYYSFGGYYSGYGGTSYYYGETSYYYGGYYYSGYTNSYYSSDSYYNSYSSDDSGKDNKDNNPK